MHKKSKKEGEKDLEKTRENLFPLWKQQMDQNSYHSYDPMVWKSMIIFFIPFLLFTFALIK